jgi:hypothetical protein
MNEDKGTYVLRSENIGKLDHRRAKEYLIYLIELLKDNGVGDDFEEYVLLVVKITTTGGSVSVNYLLRVINPENANDK